jgi:hypothetical protein
MTRLPYRLHAPSRRPNLHDPRRRAGSRGANHEKGPSPRRRGAKKSIRTRARPWRLGALARGFQSTREKGSRPPRNGYAMVLVLVFIALMLTFYSVAYRRIGAALRAETIRTLQTERNEGCIHAAARGLALLETGLPPSNPYVCGTSVGSPPRDRSFTVTFGSQEEGVWWVHAAPTVWPDEPEPMPASFAEATAP